MDYLDPKKRRAYHVRLYLGYFLVAVVIGLATYIITAGLNGYGLNVKTGQIVQNGLLFVNSKPAGAEIFLNGKDQNATSPARLVLPSGGYSLKLTKDGYRDWNGQFTLNEQSVARYQYPLLFPTKPKSTDLKPYPSLPPLITQSPDQKWLLVEDPSVSSAAPTFDEYDTTTLDKTTPTVTTVAVPAAVLTNYSSGSALTEVEWSTDNTSLLLEHNYGAGVEFILFNRAHPDQSINLNSSLSITPTEVSLYNKSADRVYVYDQTDQTLSLADVSAKSVGQPILRHVLYFKPYGKNLINYITDNNQPSGQVAAKIWDNGQTYSLNQLPAGTAYMIETAQYQGHFYYADGSNKSDRITIFKDPEANLKNPAVAKALPTKALDIAGATKLKFSSDAQLIAVENGQEFGVYDIETATAYEYTLSNHLASMMSWMDGDRFIGDSNDSVLVMDYTGTNKQSIVPTSLTIGGLFSPNYNHLLTIAPSDDKASFILKDVAMRAGADLPRR